MRKTTFKVLPYFISNYLFLLIVIIYGSTMRKKKEKVYLPSRKCNPDTTFYESYNPDYFYHLTDLHIKHYNNNSQINLIKALDVGSSYKSDFLLITGDLADNIKRNKCFTSTQSIEDWEVYNSTIEKYSSKFKMIIDAMGNHDGSRVWSLHSDNFYYGKYSQASKYFNVTRSMHDLEMYIKEFGNFTHIIMNPFEFPIIPIPFTYDPYPPSDILDRLEEEIEKANDKKSLIVSNHFHGFTWTRYKSSKGRTLFDILNNKKVSLFIAGHNHVKISKIIHHNNAIEITAGNLGYSKRGGFVTEDNRMTVYHPIDIEDPEDFFITYPVPVNQTTQSTVCDVGFPLIRVIAFRKDEDLVARIDGGENQKLNLDRELKEGVYLFSAHLKELSKGFHNISVFGKQKNQTLEFIYDAEGETPSGKENSYDAELPIKYRLHLFLVLYIVALFVTFPFDVLLFNDYTKWICNKTWEEKSVFYWTLTIFCGFIGIRKRLAGLNKTIRFLLFASVIITPFIPLRVYHIDDHLMFSFGIGNLVNGKIRYEKKTNMVLYSFMVVSMFPVIQAFSALSFYLKEKNRFVGYVDLSIYCLYAFISFYKAVNGFVLLDGEGDCYKSAFIWFTLLWALIMAIYYKKYCNKWAKLNNNEDNIELLTNL